MNKYLLLLLSFLCAGSINAQRLKSIKIKDPIICYASTENHKHNIPPPQEYLEYLNNPTARTKTSTFEVTYIGFSEEAKTAFQKAVDIWSTIIDSPMPIRIEARWTPLGASVLGSAIYTSAFANFTGAQKLDVFYPVAIAEKITGRELNDGEADLVANFNSNNTSWHYNINTQPGSGKYDLTTVVLHEIGHGLGFAGTFTAGGTQGQYGLIDTDTPIIYDVFIQNGSEVNLIEQFSSPSTSLRSQLVGNDLFFNSPTSTRPKLYAPITFNGGSSISHLDENAYSGTGNALMTPQIAPQEQIQNPGISLNMLNDMGWRVLKIKHQPISNTENEVGPAYTVTATIEADVNGFNASTFKLNYTTNGSTFTTVDMVPTGTANEYTAQIPSTGVAQTYGYYLTAKDLLGVEFVNPGKIIRPLNTPLQNVFVFETGPDTEPPVITHNQKPFLLDSDTELQIDARVIDNISVSSVTLEYWINNVAQGSFPLTLVSPEEDSIYSVTIAFAQALVDGDQVQYKITATDNAAAGPFQATSPDAGLYTVNVVGLEPTQDSYSNNFNSVSTDFFGIGFSITTPSGFTDGAIHSEHPYLEGNGFPGNERELIYQLRIPIRVKETDATIKFDEIVLVEPGDPGAVFGDDEFWDYVVVEGSKDGGSTWIPVADGYDAQANSAWLTRYNSAIVDNKSTALGDPTLYRTRTLNLLAKFLPNDEVILRFRLYSDQLASGWGWAIDNLKIQIDETPPTLLHTHVDYVIKGIDLITFTSKVADASGINELKIEYSINTINAGAFTTQSFTVEPLANEYNFQLGGLNNLDDNSVIEYRWVAVDNAGNSTQLPQVGFLQVPIIEFTAPVTTYSNTFNAPATDFVGNYFALDQPAGFNNGAIHSVHSYPLGFGIDKTSNFSYTLKKPITIGSQNTYIRYDEIALIEGHPLGAFYGEPAFKDYAVVEGSKDNGQTWLPIEDGYDNLKKAEWTSAFNGNINGSSALFITNVVDLTENGNFATGDNVILRFRLFSNETINGWGWAIDNLYIQDPITSREKELDRAISVYPNPTKNNIVIEASGLTATPINIQVVSTQGQLLYSSQTQSIDGKLNHTIAGDMLPKGLFFVKILAEGSQIIRKIVKVD